ncbi:hypothetical protein [Clostridium sp. SM-530-WT-3G]|uniref:hypothetical protein n=1 Tax=Clostridium sp. SM-530-WT-3G TaxID=2725303 RepID=UPI00145EB6B5|nr:hypothetical protein [Clostridium sp. SM-530-WT-3G]NME82993.1 hypothetical protein [Clostridium sp. SM-530-WT-3G]
MSLLNLRDNCKKKLEKNSRFIEGLLIEYSDEELLKDFVKQMEKGYKEMAEINLEYSKLGSEYVLDDVNEYEAWICGV